MERGLCYFYISKLIIIIKKWAEPCGTRGYCSALPLKRPSFDSGWNIWLPGAGGCCISQLVAKYLSQLHQLVESSLPVAGLIQFMSCTFFAAEMWIRTILIYGWHFCQAYQTTYDKHDLLGKQSANTPWRNKIVVQLILFVWSSKRDVTLGQHMEGRVSGSQKSQWSFKEVINQISADTWKLFFQEYW